MELEESKYKKIKLIDSKSIESISCIDYTVWNDAKLYLRKKPNALLLGFNNFIDDAIGVMRGLDTVSPRLIVSYEDNLFKDGPFYFDDSNIPYLVRPIASSNKGLYYYETYIL